MYTVINGRRLIIDRRKKPGCQRKHFILKLFDLTGSVGSVQLKGICSSFIGMSTEHILRRSKTT